MIHKIDRFGSAHDDFGGIVHDISLPDLRAELEIWRYDKNTHFETILCNNKKCYYTNIYVGPCSTWKYRIIHLELSDVDFLQCYT